MWDDAAAEKWNEENPGAAAQEVMKGLSSDEQAGVAAGLGGLALVLLIVGIVAAVAVVVAILAATTGIFIAHKKMHTLDNHTFEGELVEMTAIPVGIVIEDPYAGISSSDVEASTRRVSNGGSLNLAFRGRTE